jgi:hypothetical protein
MDEAESPKVPKYPDILSLIKNIMGLKRTVKAKGFERTEPVTEKSIKNRDNLFSLLFYDDLAKSRFDHAKIDVLNFVIFRNSKIEERKEVDHRVDLIIRDWEKLRWITTNDQSRTLSLTKDGTEHVIRINTARRGGSCHWRHRHFRARGARDHMDGLQDGDSRHSGGGRDPDHPGGAWHFQQPVVLPLREAPVDRQVSLLTEFVDRFILGRLGR